MMRSVPATDILTRLNQLTKLAAIISPTTRQRTADARPTRATSRASFTASPHAVTGYGLGIDRHAQPRRVRQCHVAFRDDKPFPHQFVAKRRVGHAKFD
jgi:hypothetical protein